MIDIANEQPLDYEAAANFMTERFGDKYSVDQIRRWIRECGLEYIQVGKKRFTTIEAINRWANRKDGPVESESGDSELEDYLDDELS